MKAPAPNGKVHEAAQEFPLLDASELQDLADDIARNGLRRPIVLMPDGTLLDGRNRLAACEKAGIEPTFQIYEGDDPVGFVVSENIKRRHLTPSQRAMLAIKIEEQYARQLAAKRDANLNTSTVSPVDLHGDELDTASKNEDKSPPATATGLAAKATGSSKASVARAKRVAQADDELAQKVAAGEIALRAAETVVRLQSEAPDLARKIRSGEMTAPAAEAEMKERAAQQAEDDAWANSNNRRVKASGHDVAGDVERQHVVAAVRRVSSAINEFCDRYSPERVSEALDQIIPHMRARLMVDMATAVVRLRHYQPTDEAIRRGMEHALPGQLTELQQAAARIEVLR